MSESFVFYESWYEVLEDERQEVQWEIIHAVMEYVFRGNLVELKPNAKMAFKFIKRDIDRAKGNYTAFIGKQSGNGSKGGAPVGNTNAKKQPKTTQTTQNNPEVEKQPKQPYNDNVNDNVNVKENVNVNSSYSEVDFEKAKKFLKNNQSIQMDRLMMQMKITKEELHAKIDEFVDKKISWGEGNWPNDSELAKNFEFWLSKRPAPANGKKVRSVY